ncbi:hypothetical protein NW801_09650 [Brevibacillus laterosporus]|uniref:MBL fold metallo-hydrolase n=1 Tax=Brevibacillus halotolerans TaxID=1507437 RepID=A0ABT4HWW1_9BACL|nr:MULTISPECIES: hypothetical protein [Brevibacillus]MCR8985334.1 hypothetical protein [Brevibacillus laterosporus]MCZ0831063.1 hypothetical protein [Brevibacillus halotolerans]
MSLQLGASIEEIKSVPVGSALWLGCGNPQTIAGVKEGVMLLDTAAVI